MKNLFRRSKNLLSKDEILSIKNSPDVIISKDTLRENRIPPGQHEVDNWPVLHAGRVQKIETSQWKLKIFGAIEDEKELNYQDFMKLSQDEVFSDIHCVTSWSQLNNLWKGVRSQTLVQLIEVQPEAKFVLIHASKHFSANLTLEEFLAEDVILATHHNRKPINKQHGGPVRLVVPQLYFWKSAKWVTGIEFLEEDKRGFWESNGYHNHGDPWREERYSWQEDASF